MRPKRRKKSAVSRLRPFWIICILLVIAAAAGGYFGATWKGFDPRIFTVKGNSIVSTPEILHAAAINRNLNMWLQNPKVIAKRIEMIPYIDRAWVHRIPPSKVSITVKERTPYAIVQSGQQVAIADHDLRVLTNEVDGNYPIFVMRSTTALLPGVFLKNPEAVELRNDYDALAGDKIATSALTLDAYGQLVATLRNGVHLLLGNDGDLKTKIPLIHPILSQLSHGKPYVAIDLRSTTTPVVVYK